MKKFLKKQKIILVILGITILSVTGVVTFILNNYEVWLVERVVKPIKLPFSNLGKCGIENCHGLDITCGPNIPEICPSFYQEGDICRQYARCEKIGGRCQLIKDPKFDECKSCVEKCSGDFKDDPIKASLCESGCIEVKSIGETCLMNSECMLPPEPYGISSYGPYDAKCIGNRCKVAVNLLTECETDSGCDCSSYNPPGLPKNYVACSCVQRNCVVIVEE